MGAAIDRIDLGPVTEWFAGNRRELPWRAAGTTPWAVLVSEVMLQQTPVARVVPAFVAWTERWPTPAALAAEPAGAAVRQWGRLGYPRRALRLHAAAGVIITEHGGVVPDDLGALLALPGCGDYTARAVLAFAYRRRVPVLDVNVARVLARSVGGRASGPASPTRADREALEALLPLPGPAAAEVCEALMELGALRCTARAPGCAGCPLVTQCRWVAAGQPDPVGPGGPGRPAAAYAGSDRQVRGILLAALRAAEEPLRRVDLDLLWPDRVQGARALAGLLADGLAAVHCSPGTDGDELVGLPGTSA